MMRGAFQLKLTQLFSSLKRTDSSQELTRFWLLRGLGLLCFCAFFPLFFQFKPLIGSEGLLPLGQFLQRIQAQLGDQNPFITLPSLFWFNYSDSFGVFLISIGTLLSLLVTAGYANSLMLFTLWLLQLSFFHIGQSFWGFGWEMNLLEIGFLGIFLVPLLNPLPFSPKSPSPQFVLFFSCLFKVMLGSGLIKIRGDSCWTELNCLFYHFETQPIPGPISPFFIIYRSSSLKVELSSIILSSFFPWLIF